MWLIVGGCHGNGDFPTYTGCTGRSTGRLETGGFVVAGCDWVGSVGTGTEMFFSSCAHMRRHMKERNSKKDFQTAQTYVSTS
jgi:hypothetical protein